MAGFNLDKFPDLLAASKSVEERAEGRIAQGREGWATFGISSSFCWLNVTETVVQLSGCMQTIEKKHYFCNALTSVE